MDEMEVDHVIKVTLTNEILKRISEIDEKRFSLSTIEMTPVIKNRLIKKYSYLKTACNQLSGLEENNINDFLNSERLSHYRTIYQNYIYEKDKKVLENKLKQMMYQKICFTRKSKNMSNYRIYKELNLNPGNANAFLKYGDVSKVSLDTARKILAFVNKY